MKVYLDIIFIVNFIMDTLILWVVSVLDRRKVRKSSVFKGAFIGSILYCLLFFLPYGGKYINLFYGALVLLVSVKVTFREKRVKVLLRLMLIALIASVLIGGTFLALYYFTNVGYSVALSIGTIRISNLIFLTAFFYFSIKLCGGFLSAMTTARSGFCRIKCIFNNSEAEITALKDTGNFLIDDCDGNKIVICEFTAVRNLFPPKDQILYLKKMAPEKILEELSVELSSRAKLIHFSSLGAAESNLTAFKIDGAEINDEKTIFIENVLIVVYNGKLSSNKSCNGIINPIIIET